MEFKIYKANGELLGNSFTWLFVDEYNNLSVRQIVRSINKIHKKYLKSEYRVNELSKLKTAYFYGAEIDIGNITDLEKFKDFDWANEKEINAKDLEDLFGYYDGLPNNEVLQLDLVYKLRLDEEAVVDIDYYLIYLSPEATERQHLRRKAVKKGIKSKNEPKAFSYSSVFDAIGIRQDDENEIARIISNFKRVIMTLTPLEQNVLAMRYGLDGVDKKSLVDIANELNILTPEDVLDIESKALRKLRHPSRFKAICENSS